jgi:SSS family solute:Na+ symporter
MSSLDSMLNSTATIFTMDLYRVWLRPGAPDRHLMTVGRWSTVAFLVLAAAWAPFLLRFDRVFSYIQEFWGLITPGVAVVFLGGLFWRRTSATAAVTVLAATLPVTLALKVFMAGSAFLNQMWVAGLLLGAVLVAISLRGRADKADGADKADAADKAVEAVRPAPDLLFDVLSYGVIVAVVALYVIFF